MTSILPAIEIETAPNPTFSVIWMHGLGADGSDFVPIVPELGLPEQPGVRFIFPDAPMMPVTCNGGYVMRAWYDIEFLDDSSRRVDERGIRTSRDAIRRLISRENDRGMPTRQIFLAGFSQGGAMAYTIGLTHPDPLAGIIALSAYIPAPALLASEASQANAGTDIFAAHGSEDDVVPLALGRAARDLLLQKSSPLEWRTYAMPHSVCEQEISDIGRWLSTRLLEKGQ